ncbi:HET-domain-containing protein [Xylaria bambusicola]|uniref:HET-domain-containing protein n=1 Tax=Xylaria bambusicola TaxID=326684 RepID=UPI0020089844|nr:HET-domain-containing protein [Xylaria bambusicola]KAI0502797.1 HET-domain-containing protein [Xylaria bambusicola]
MALCQHCDQFDIQSLLKPGSTLRFNCVDVKAASDAGCEFCSFLYRRVHRLLNSVRARKDWRGPLYIQLSTDEKDSASKKRAHEAHTVQVDRLYISVVPRVYLHSQWLDSPDWPVSPNANVLGVIADPGSPAARSGDVTGRLRDLKENNCAEVISEWLASCLQHPKCKETASGTQFDVWNQPLPTRCVHIEPDGSGKKLFRLRETGGQPGTYVTLSHRWNGHTTLAQTTTSNYNRRLAGDFGFLPVVFLEAMDIALAQGIQDIWIDSLCIIQVGDGGVDWGREAVRMAEYYQHSVFTIMCAVNAPFNGMFRPQPPMNLIRLPYRDEQGCHSGYFFVFDRHSTRITYLNFSDVFMRGWVFQEWLLSRRLVNFTDVGIFFSCQSSQPLYEDLTEVMLGLEGNAFEGLKPFFNNRAPVGELWYRLINRYSGLHLTKKEDRLIAIAGIGEEYRRILIVQKETELRYVAGLWMWDIHRGLLWHRLRHPLGTLLSTQPTGPSWSWTSATYVVDWYHPKLTFTYRAKKCTIEPLEETDSKHQLRLAIKGKLLPVVVRQEIPWEGDSAQVIRPMTGTAFLSKPESNKVPLFRAVCSVRKPELIAGWGSFEGEGIQARLGSSAGISVFALLVQSRYRFSNSDAALGRVTPILSIYDVLFLDPVADSERKYCRVGAGCLFERELCREFSPLLAADIELV